MHVINSFERRGAVFGGGGIFALGVYIGRYLRFRISLSPKLLGRCPLGFRPLS